MSSDREATSEQSSSVHEGVGYDEVYLSGHRPKEGFSLSSKREPSAHSFDDKERSYDGVEVEEREGEEDEDEYDKGEGGREEGENEEYEGEGDESEGN